MYDLPDDIRAATGLTRGVNAYESRQLYDEIFRRGTYEVPFEVVGPSPRVLDLGANVGMFAAYARRRWCADEVCCVEPIPTVAEIARHNFRNDPRVSVREVAVSSERGWVEITYFPECSILSGIGVSAESAALTIQSFIEDAVQEMEGDADAKAALRAAAPALAAQRSTTERIRVPTVTLAALLTDFGPTDVLKIDIEGAEVDALRSLPPSSWDRLRCVVVEPELDDREVVDLVGLFEARDFSVVVPDRGRPAPSRQFMAVRRPR